MKKITLLILIISVSSMIFLAYPNANIKMLNGDEIPCSVMTPTINIITDYGELEFKTEYIKEIQFPEPGKGNTMLKTVFGELFRGFITNDTIKLNMYGKELIIRKAKINKIEFANDLKKPENYKLTVALRNGDGFFGNMVGEMMTIQTSYGEIELPFENMLQISFEGFGNVLSKINMKDGGTVQGIIKDEYLPLRLLSDIELEVVPDLMKQIGFANPVLKTEEKNEESLKNTEVFSPFTAEIETEKKENVG